eukprot:TRINITY_DN2955_c1_g1_i1.p1 TRINITY_DN2955_c1_g1~~TRINITY_DN2955_c1_g1_i1.p1  ORF type:complete len:239 (+),score=4.68 TRINITY_DN2955_c1_g1_i1:103-819(+)
MDIDRIRREVEIQYYSLKRRWNRTDACTQKVVVANAIILGLSKVPSLRGVMHRHFVASWRASVQEKRFYTVSTSVFSHSGFLHLALNSFVAYNTIPFLKRGCDSKNPWLSVDNQVLAFIIASGTAASCGGLLMSRLISQLRGSCFSGMSGATCASFGVMSVTHPSLQWQILFFPEPLSTEMMFSGLIAWDLLGLSYVLLGGSSVIAHHVHLPGALIGYAAGTYFFKPNIDRSNKWSIW